MTYSQLRVVEYFRIVTDFFRNGVDPLSKYSGDFSLIITKNNITSHKITTIQGPQRPNLAVNISVFCNLSERTNQITRNFLLLLLMMFYFSIW